MIPKIIHFCWLSNDNYPEKIQKCIDSWKKYLPDYELVHWNFERFPRGTSKWVDQAFDSHKYAFAADYLRLYALYHYGGIYLDSDVEVLKTFDDLLDLPYFIGKEPSPTGVEAAIIGAEKGNQLIKDMLDSYDGKNFLQPDGGYDVYPLPYKFRACIESQYTYHPIESKKEFVFDEDVVNIFPVDFFSPKNFNTLEIHLTQRTYCIHHFTGSWMKNTYKETAEVWKVKVRRGILKGLNRKSNLMLISNSNIDTMYDISFSVEKHSPVFTARMSTMDFLNFLSLRSRWKDLRLIQMKRRSSKYVNLINSFYPIACIEGTDIELHFVSNYSMEQVKKVWRNGIENMENAEIWPILASDDINAIHKFENLTPHKGIVLTSLKDSKSSNCIHVDSLNACNEKSRGRGKLMLEICKKLNWF